MIHLNDYLKQLADMTLEEIVVKLEEESEEYSKALSESLKSGSVGEFVTMITQSCGAGYEERHGGRSFIARQIEACAKYMLENGMTSEDFKLVGLHYYPDSGRVIVSQYKEHNAALLFNEITKDIKQTKSDILAVKVHEAIRLRGIK